MKMQKYCFYFEDYGCKCNEENCIPDCLDLKVLFSCYLVSLTLSKCYNYINFLLQGNFLLILDSNI